MPIRRTVPRRNLSREFTRPGEMAFFDDDKATLVGRVQKLGTGTAWAEGSAVTDPVTS
ncbi:3-phenylpropionate/cinnamic acid dioxygenase small subunit [Streptomyces sp. SAI-124]